MFENLFKRKNKKDKSENDNVENLNEKENQEVYLVKNLYVAYPALISYKNSNNCFVYNEGSKDLEKIIVKKLNECYVFNILNSREYGIFSKFNAYKLKDFLNQYMVNKLHPLELILNDKTKTFITKQEIIELLYPEMKPEDEPLYRDVIVQEISKTLTKINDSNIKEEEKEKLRDMLLSIANYYENSLQINNPSLNIVDLRMECLKRLVEIEIKLPSENVNNSIGEIAILKGKILKK